MVRGVLFGRYIFLFLVFVIFFFLEEENLVSALFKVWASVAVKFHKIIVLVTFFVLDITTY